MNIRTRPNNKEQIAPVAQLEERLRPKEMVGGSIPPGGGF